MRPASPVLLVAVSALVGVYVAGLKAQMPELESSNETVPHPSQTQGDLPRVLIIGDSISMGYTQPVRKLLAGVADVRRIPTNGGPTTKGLKEIDQWLGDSKWDVIHFNWGLHDLKYMKENGEITSTETGRQQVPLADYEKNLGQLVERMKKTGAKLIWCSTTPVPQGAVGRIPGDEVVYNRAAAKVMQAHGVPINDLYRHAAENVPTRPRDVHYTDEGSQKLAEQVAAAIRKQLDAAPK